MPDTGKLSALTKFLPREPIALLIVLLVVSCLFLCLYLLGVEQSILLWVLLPAILLALVVARCFDAPFRQRREAKGAARRKRKAEEDLSIKQHEAELTTEVTRREAELTAEFARVAAEEAMARARQEAMEEAALRKREAVEDAARRKLEAEDRVKKLTAQEKEFLAGFIERHEQTGRANIEDDIVVDLVRKLVLCVGSGPTRIGLVYSGPLPDVAVAHPVFIHDDVWDYLQSHPDALS